MRNKKEDGMTLMELMVVISIIGLLLAVFTPWKFWGAELARSNLYNLSSHIQNGYMQSRMLALSTGDPVNVSFSSSCYPSYSYVYTNPSNPPLPSPAPYGHAGCTVTPSAYVIDSGGVLLNSSGYPSYIKEYIKSTLLNTPLLLEFSSIGNVSSCAVSSIGAPCNA